MREMKDSGILWIGEIPKNKKVLRNKYMFSYEKGKLPSSTNLDKKGFAYIGATDLDSRKNEYSNYTEDETLPNAEYNDLLVLWDGARAGLCGTHKIGRISSTIVRIKGDESVYQPFLYWYYKGFENFMYQSVNGTTIPHMNRKYIENIGFIDWTIEEQQKISTYLDTKCTKIDSIIEKQEKVIEKLKAYKLSVITEAVTKGLNPDVKMKDSGVEWIGEIPEHWQSVKIKYCTYIRARLGWKGLKADEYVETGFPLLSAFNIVNDKLVFENLNFINQVRYDESPEIKLSEGDIILVKDGAGIGKCAIINYLPYPSTTNGSLAVITTDSKLYPNFLYYYFLTSIFQKFIDRLKDGMGVPHLFQSDLKEIKIVIPCYSEQQQIVDYLDKKCSAIDSAIEQKQAIIEKLKEYKKSLIYEVVTGKKEV